MLVPFWCRHSISGRQLRHPSGFWCRLTGDSSRDGIKETFAITASTLSTSASRTWKDPKCMSRRLSAVSDASCCAKATTSGSAFHRRSRRQIDQFTSFTWNNRTESASWTSRLGLAIKLNWCTSLASLTSGRISIKSRFTALRFSQCHRMEQLSTGSTHAFQLSSKRKLKSRIG